MITPAILSSLIAQDVATITALAARCERRHKGHTRTVLCSMRCQHEHEHDGALTDDDRRTLASYYHARREYWRDRLPTTNDIAAADDAAALAALALGAPEWHRGED